MRHFASRCNALRFGIIASVVCAGAMAILAQDQKKPEPSDSELPAKKKQALATLRRELPAKSEYFSYGPGDLDAMLALELRKLGRSPGEPATDEIFVRRAHLDITGKLPTPDATRNFTADADPKKRSKLIDQLLDSDDYARNWARY